MLTKWYKDEIYQHVHQRQPVDGRLLFQAVLWQTLVVEAKDDVGDDVEVDPHVGVRHREQREQRQHQPAPLVQHHLGALFSELLLIGVGIFRNGPRGHFCHVNGDGIVLYRIRA